MSKPSTIAIFSRNQGPMLVIELIPAWPIVAVACWNQAREATLLPSLPLPRLSLDISPSLSSLADPRAEPHDELPKPVIAITRGYNQALLRY